MVTLFQQLMSSTEGSDGTMILRGFGSIFDRICKNSSDEFKNTASKFFRMISTSTWCEEPALELHHKI